MELVGYSTEEVMGHSLVQEFITDDFKSPVQAVLDQALHGKETANFEFPLITKAGARMRFFSTLPRVETNRVISLVWSALVRILQVSFGICPFVLSHL